MKALVELPTFASEDSVQLFLIETPLNPLTQEEIETNLSAEDDLWRRQVAEACLRGERIPLNEALAGDWTDYYIDYGHTTSTGARAYSKGLALWLRDKVPTARTAPIK